MIRVPQNFNGQFITRHFFPDYLKHNNVRGINSGRCYDWAYFAYRMFPNVELWTTDYHAWIHLRDESTDWKNLFFDSETLKGVTNFMLLGCNRRHGPAPWDLQPPRRMGVELFKSFWNEHGGGYKRHWDSMLEKDLQRVLGKRYSEMTPIFAKPKPALVVP